MNRINKHKRVQRKIFIGIGYPLLLAAAFCTMVPLLWLLSSSFKTADEVFAVPIRWLPKLPPRITSSPYIVTKAYPSIKKPATVDAETWKTLQSQIEEAIWINVQEQFSGNLSLETTNLSEEIRTEFIEGIWQQHVVTLPAEVWNESTTSIVNQVESAIIPETVETIWRNIYRQLVVGTIEIEDVEFNRIKVDLVKWNTDSVTRTQIQESLDSTPVIGLIYNFQEENSVNLITSIQSSVPIERIRRIILPIRGDASYHHLSLEVSVNGTTYIPTEPFVLDSALEEDTVWRLHGIPGELESSHISMQQSLSRQDYQKLKTDYH